MKIMYACHYTENIFFWNSLAFLKVTSDRRAGQWSCSKTPFFLFGTKNPDLKNPEWKNLQEFCHIPDAQSNLRSLCTTSTAGSKRYNQCMR